MIISHKHKFIFIKNRKTAGTSLEIALASLCGPKDIITRISKEDEKVRKEKLGFRGEQNIYLPFWRYTCEDWQKLAKNRSLKKFENHMSVRELLKLIPRKTWEEYFTFTFERNPWDKTISHYLWANGPQKYSSIKEYLENRHFGLVRGYDLYSINNLPAVDKVYKMEEMDAALADISKKLGLDKPLELPKYKAKGGVRKDKRHYSEILTDEEKEMISLICAREIKLLGYEY